MSAAASQFSIDIRTTPPSGTRMTLRGEFDVAAAPDLRAAFDRIGPERSVTVLMRDVTFCDAATVGILVEERDRRATRLRVAKPSPTMTRLARILDLPWLADGATTVDGESGTT